MKSLLYPKLRLDLLPTIVAHTLLGDFIAGFYGLLHDQIAYSKMAEPMALHCRLLMKLGTGEKTDMRKVR